MKNFGNRLRELIFEEGAVQRFQEQFQEISWDSWDLWMEKYLECLNDDGKKEFTRAIENSFQNKTIGGLLLLGFRVSRRCQGGDLFSFEFALQRVCQDAQNQK